MTNGIRTTHHQPSPFTGLPTGHAVNFDNYGSFWGTDGPEITQALIERERTAGVPVEEWNVLDRDGQPLRIVRCPDPTFLDTICVIPGETRSAVAA